MKFLKFLWLSLTMILILIACSDNDKNEVLDKHDPNKEIMISGFFPDSGYIASQVIIEGSNFGSDTSQVRLYFNEKRATIINAQGNKLYALTPRLPGDTCTLKLVIGQKEAIADQEFRYKTQMNVSTIAGSRGANDGHFLEGSLATAAFGNIRGTVADSYGNIFVSMYGTGTPGVARVDTKGNAVTWVTDASNYIEAWNSPTKNPVSNVIYFPSNTGAMVLELNPLNLWTPRIRNIKAPSKEQIEGGMYDADPLDFNRMHSLAYNPADGKLYTRTYQGGIGRIEPVTYVGEILGGKGAILDRIIDVDSYVAIDHNDPDWLYISYFQKNCIRRVNIKTFEWEDYVGMETGAGSWRDGVGKDAEFNQPRCIIFDNESNMYIADMGNQCIRKVTKEKVVSTITGIPQSWGTADGPPELAQFDNPFGIDIDHEGNIYIGEAANNRMIRKLTME
ncbi:MAG: IPT/TIG domain-containing protein [Dysgonomonas sp.]|nr:IPT/TIG domain-containing protein [Dysgonomonas sp.]